MFDKDVKWWITPSIFIAVLLIFFIFFAYISSTKGEAPEMAMGVYLVLGVIALIAALAFTTQIFSALKLTNTTNALGLPEGSIRAIIALSLIMIFVTSSVFLYYSTSMGTRSFSGRVTSDLIEKLPNETIVSIDYRGQRENESVYDVAVVVPRTKASEDLAKQLVTTVSTLAVAVAGFYFGTKAVVTAQGRGPGSSDPLIRSIEPDKNDKKRDVDIPFIIQGKNFYEPKVTLVHGEEKIQCTDVTSSSTTIRGNIRIPTDDKKFPAGKWSVMVENSGTGEDILKDSFEILGGTPAGDVKSSTPSSDTTQKPGEKKPPT